MKNIIILSTQRSGSTMICDDFEGTGILGRPSEYFINATSKFVANNDVLAKELLSEVLQKGLGENGVSSVKVMSNQIEAIKKLIITSKLTGEDKPDYAFKQYFSNYVFVRIKRLDKVAQAVSRLSAEQTGVYHSTSGGEQLEGMLAKTSSKERDEEGLQISVEDIDLEIKRIENEERYLERLIQKLDLEVTDLVYEECIDNRDYLFSIGKLLNIKVEKIAERRLKKVSKSKTREIIELYKSKKKLSDLDVEIPNRILDGCKHLKSKFNSQFNYVDIISPIKRAELIKNYKLTAEEQLFIAASVFYDSDSDLYHKANAALVLGYRSLDIKDDFYFTWAIKSIKLIIKSLVKQEHNGDNKNVKFNRNHMLISLNFLLSQMSIAVLNASLFMKGIVSSLKVIEEEGLYLKNSYYSINMVLNLCAIYLPGKYFNKLLELNIELSKLSYKYHDEMTPWTRFKEFSSTVQNLSVMQEYKINHKLTEKKFFYSSVRCTDKEYLYKRFCILEHNESAELVECISGLYEKYT